MIRGFFRLIGLLLLAGAFIFVVYDGVHWVVDQNFHLTRFGQFWLTIHEPSETAFRHWVEARSPWLWTTVVQEVLRQAVFIILGVPGIILMILFRPRRPLIGYARN
ncbi:MAG: hypothetical protein FWD68_00345 [Alphaproteobacteria bacterium]|nr:hypothetical protein [Alphaproteobacteria bacterium]